MVESGFHGIAMNRIFLGSHILPTAMTCADIRYGSPHSGGWAGSCNRRET